MSLLTILQSATEYLKKRGIPNARVDAEWLLAAVLRCRRLDLYLRFNDEIHPSQRLRYKAFLTRRGRREPLQYILGETEFCGLPLKVDSRVLIPRPETEELVELLRNRLQATPPQSILDLGTGSGAIILALGKAFPQATLVAVDLSESALEVARQNAAMCQMSSRIALRQSHWFSQVVGRYDLIVGNPPYLSEAEWHSAAPEVHHFEPSSALWSPNDGGEDLREIIQLAPQFLNSSGLLALETGIDQHRSLRSIAENATFRRQESLRDFSGRDRFLLLSF